MPLLVEKGISNILIFIIVAHILLYLLHYIRGINLSAALFNPESQFSFLIIFVNFLRTRGLDEFPVPFRMVFFTILWLFVCGYKIHQLTANKFFNNKYFLIAFYICSGIIAHSLVVIYFQDHKHLSGEELHDFEIYQKQYIHAYDFDFIFSSYLNMPFQFIFKLMFEIKHNHTSISFPFHNELSMVIGSEASLYGLIGADFVITLFSKNFFLGYNGRSIFEKIYYLISLFFVLFPFYVEIIETPFVNESFKDSMPFSLYSVVHLARRFGFIFGFIIASISLIFEN